MAALLALAAAPARALELFVTVNSSSVANGTAGFLDFQFSAGASTAQTAQAVVKNFSSTALTPGGITFTNGASGGPLPTNVTILNNPYVLSNRARQAMTYGSGSAMSFTLEITGNALTTPGTADSTFYFSLLNSSNQSIFGAYSLPHLAITIPANGSGVPAVSSIALITALIVPEPGTVVLALTGVAVLVLARRRRKAA